jgi:uncharacterized protein YwbE
MSSLQKIARKNSLARRNLWFERLMAIAATANLGLVLFDLSYIPLRDFWLHGTLQVLDFKIQIPLPPVTKWYDPLKGIEPYRETQAYLETVDRLQAQLNAPNALQSPQVEQTLQELRRKSSEMIDTNPFQIANKSGTLERIKNRMRNRLNRESARESFNILWSQGHLAKFGTQQELAFFNNQIRPLIETNYFRQIGENSEFVDLFFWRIDQWFALVFGLEFLARTFYISRRHTGVKWTDAMLWRWYDLFLILPIYWVQPWMGLLRVIPVMIRLDDAKLLNLERIHDQINRGVVANFAEEITEVVVVQVIDQMQGSIKRGEISRWLTQSENRPYIDLNNTNEVEAIAEILTKLVVYQIVPKIQPDIEAILRHNIESILSNLPAYRSLQGIPGLGSVPAQLTDKLVTEISQALYEALKGGIEDPVGAKLTAQLVQHLGEAIASEAKNQHTLERLQTLLVDMLEEIKINYVERLSQEDVEAVLEQTRQLRQLAHPQENQQIIPSKLV